MGIGIWSMHFIGLIAYDINVPILYDGLLTLLSLLLAVGTSFTAFYSTVVFNQFLYKYILSGFLMGIGITVMHMIGMEAMVIPFNTKHTAHHITLAFVIAIVASTFALLLLSKLNNRGKIYRPFILPSAILMGLAISGMHYTAMAGFEISKEPVHPDTAWSSFIIHPEFLTAQVSLVSLGLITISVIFSTLDHRKSVLAISNSQKRYELIATHSSDMVAEIDDNGKIIYLTPSYEQALGFQLQQMLQYSFWISTVHPEDVGRVLQSINCGLKQYNEKANSIEYRQYTAEGKWIWLETNLTQIVGKDKKIRSIVLSSKDITDRKTYEQKLTDMAYYDMLTKIPNRQYFEYELKRVIQKAKRRNETLAVLYFDCDQFKWVNDSFGHNVGDKLLQKLVQIVKTCIREQDVMGRFGGDEFVILLKDVTKETVIEIADNIIDVLNKPIEVENIRIVVTPSIGISLYPYHSKTADDLIKYADRALYNVKNKGKNGYQFFNDELSENVEEEILLSADLRQANKEEEFFLHYQPILNVETNKIHAVEALIRWKHQQYGYVAPQSVHSYCRK
nr:diguanylate cyclase [Salirhabdus salicampi]